MMKKILLFDLTCLAKAEKEIESRGNKSFDPKTKEVNNGYVPAC